MTRTVPRPRSRFRARNLAQPTIALLLMVFLLGVPFWLVVVTAGKNQAEALNPSLTLPTKWNLLENFSQVIQDGRMVTAFFGSLVIMIPSFLGVLILCSLASWILGRMKDNRTSCFYALCFNGIVIPPSGVPFMLLL